MHIMNARDIRVVGGSLDRFEESEATYIGRAQELIVHPKYNGNFNGNDIAIIIVRYNLVKLLSN